MILIEPSAPLTECRLTNPQLYRIGTLMAEYGWDLDYEITTGWTNLRPDVVHLWVYVKGRHPRRVHIDPSGDVIVTEEILWKEVTQP